MDHEDRRSRGLVSWRVRYLDCHADGCRFSRRDTLRDKRQRNAGLGRGQLEVCRFQGSLIPELSWMGHVALLASRSMLCLLSPGPKTIPSQSLFLRRVSPVPPAHLFLTLVLRLSSVNGGRYPYLFYSFLGSAATKLCMYWRKSCYVRIGERKRLGTLSQRPLETTKKSHFRSNHLISTEKKSYTQLTDFGCLECHCKKCLGARCPLPSRLALTPVPVPPLLSVIL